MATLIPKSAKVIGEFQNSLSRIMNDSAMSIEAKSTKTSFWPRKMYLAAFTALLSAVAVGLVTGYSAPATYDMEVRSSSRVKPNADQVTWIGSVMALGCMVGGLIAGQLADKIGRKDTIFFNIIPLSTGWLAICYANNVNVIILGRFISGIGVGMASTTIPLYCVEISTPEVRGILGSFYKGFQNIGHLLCVSVGSYVTWDYLALTGLVFAIFAMICFCPMPETPRWYLMKNKLNDAVHAMEELQGGQVDAEEECNLIYQELKKHPKERLTFKEFKHPTVYKPALIVITLLFFLQCSGANAVFAYSSDIFTIAKDFMNPKYCTVILAAVQVVATILSNFIVDKTGRKVLLILSGTFMALTITTLGIYYYISNIDVGFQSKYSWLPLSSLILYTIAYSIGFGPIPHLLMAEMVPVRARSTIAGMSIFFLSVFGFIIMKTFSDLENLLHNYGVFWFFGCFNVIAALLSAIVVPETKGRRLEEIGNLFHNPKLTQNHISISTIS